MSKIHAILIGINEYPKNKLRGCINDVLDIHQFLESLTRSNPEIDSYSPAFYLAPNATDKITLDNAKIAAEAIQAPTRENIIDSFQHFDKAESGDICVLYYSGHGSFNDAPEAFWHMKSARQVETLVCVDSRLPQGRDLVDKELGYLLWNATKGKEDVHFLVIMDSCHSGDNTRSGAGEVLCREATPNINNGALLDYHGFEEGGNDFYQYSGENKIDMPFGNYIHLAAARENQSAKEMYIDGQRRGVFTYALLKTLRNGGTRQSYDNLLEQVRLLVKNRTDRQLPQVTPYGSMKKNQPFLGTGFQSPAKEYAVFFDEADKLWCLDAGQINGIYPSSSKQKTLLDIVDKQGQFFGQAEVISVDIARTILKLSPSDLTLDKATIYKGQIKKLACPSLKINIDTTLSDAEIAEIKTEASQHPYFLIVDSNQATHTIRKLDGEYTLTKSSDVIPLFKRTSDIIGLVDNIAVVARWYQVLEMENPNTAIETNDIQIEVEVVEGETISGGTIDLMDNYAPSDTLNNPAAINLKYVNDKQPAIRVKIKTLSKTYFVSALYMGSKFGISTYLENTPDIQVNGDGESLKFQYQKKEYNTIPLNFDKKYHNLGITQIADYLKIFVSTQHFDLSKYQQAELKLDESIKGITRGDGFDEPTNFEDWRCITIPIYITRPSTKKTVPIQLSNGTNQVNGLEIIAPANFTANATTATNNDIQKLLIQSAKSTDAATFNAAVLPPNSIWGNIPTASTVLSRGELGGLDNQVSVLELEEVSGELSTEHPLLIKTDQLETEEALISYGYDPETGLYLPCGFADEDGTIALAQLPPSTEGKLVLEPAIDDKSIGRSVKLFFKKIIGKPFIPNLDLNELRLRRLDAKQGVTSEIIPDDFLNDPEIKNVALLIHGIIGHTQPIVDSVFHLTELYKEFDAVLTFDYENLDTKIQDTAIDLKKKLLKAGLFKIEEPRLTIIAHSMGGLVSRSLVENAKGHVVLKQLIQLGTPNNGSEIGDFRKSVFGMLAKAMNGAASTKIYIQVLAFLGKSLSKRIFTTLDQMRPNSPFLIELNRGEKNIAPYKIIVGDTSLITVEHAKNDRFLKRWLQAIKQKGHYVALNFLVFKDVHNDMAVRTDSMRRVYDENTTDSLKDKVFVVPCDHISYFQEEEVLRILKSLV